MADPTNAQRFITAYNEIDQSLRVQYNYKRSMSFQDVIRRSVPVNQIVRRYEDKLIDYGRLRNAIIHRSNEDYIIAEPHGEVVLELEKISRLITTPPTVLSVIGHTSVTTVDGKDSLIGVLKLMARTKFSNIPVYDGDTLIGVANGQRIIDKLGQIFENSKNIDETLHSTTIREVVEPDTSPYSYFQVAKPNVSIEEVLEMFFQNRKLYVILITKDGTEKEKPLGIITTGDLIELNTVLDNY